MNLKYNFFQFSFILLSVLFSKELKALVSFIKSI